jgi:hemerythrin-like domain-containing protein
MMDNGVLRQKKIVVSDNERMQSADPLDLLKSEHTELLLELKKIASAAASIQDNGFSAQAFQQIADTTRRIDSRARRHGDIEDHYLFPLLEKHSGESPVTVRHERREMWRVFNELLKAVKDVEDGRIHGTTVRELLQLAHTVDEEFRHHFEKEDTVIFPLARRLLTPTEYAQLTKDVTSAIAADPL